MGKRRLCGPCRLLHSESVVDTPFYFARAWPPVVADNEGGGARRSGASGPLRRRTKGAARPSSAKHPDLADLVGGPFRDVLPRRAQPRGRYTVRDQWLDLVAVAQHPRKVFNWRHLLALLKRTTDFFGHRRTWFGAFLTKVNPYPYPFRRVAITSFDGTVISGWLGLQPNRRPGILIVPGMFSSKDDTVHKAKAIRMWRRWNYNVLIIDLRGFGQSEGHPNTPGWKEAEDVLAAARFLDSFNNVAGVGVLGESMGATAALLAAAQEGLWEEEALARLEGRAAPEVPAAKVEGVAAVAGLAGPAPLVGADARPKAEYDLGVPGRLPTRVLRAVLAFSPFGDGRRAVEHINRMPARRDPFYFVQRLFIRLLTMHTRGQHRDFVAYMRESAHHYGVTEDEMYGRSDLWRMVPYVRCPTLIVHAEDDVTVPVEHAHIIAERVRGRDDIVVWTVPWGRHVEFELLDRRWHWRVMSRFLGQWLGR